MTLTAAEERELIAAAIRAFLPLDAPVTVDQLTDRGVKFVNDFAATGSEQIAEIKRILEFLNAALVGVAKDDRGAVRQRLTRMEEGEGLFFIAPTLTSDLARFAQRLAVLCMYGYLDTNGVPVMAERLGYTTYEKRNPNPVLPPEAMIPPEFLNLPGQGIPNHTFDFVVVGSGSAGSVLIERLVKKGHDVAVIELGDYVPEGRDSVGPGGKKRPRVHDELDNLIAYYKDAGLQLTQGHNMFVFQGQCLGGSSVVNNAVCFEMPKHIRDRWETSFGIPFVNNGTLDTAYKAIKDEFNIGPIAERSKALNPSGEILRKGAVKLGFPDGAIELNLVNMSNVKMPHDPECLGCGYCNLTCGYLRKNSVLQVSLPSAVKSAQNGTGKLTIFVGRKALEIRGDKQGGSFKAQGVRVADRKSGLDEAVILGKNVLVCAGAVGSSAVLLGSPGIRALSLPIGEKFSMNMGSPIHAEFDKPVNAFQGTQMAHNYRPRAADGYIIETWFNTPAQQSLALPGWMDDLEHNISRYAHYACAAPLVGTTSKSFISKSTPGAKEDINIRLQDSDLDKLKAGLKTVCDLFWNSDPKPKRLLLGTRKDWEIEDNNYTSRISAISSFSEIQIATAHPQGGNRMSSKPGTSQGDGVVDSNFKLYGSSNVYVCDASVFPASLGVNPHWTIMALAHVASQQF